LTKHFVIRDALIAFNTLVDNASAIEIGYDGGGFQGNWWRMPPEGLTIANNIVLGRGDSLIRNFASPLRSRWEGNIAFSRDGRPADGSLPEGITIADPGLRKIGGIWRPGRGSRAIGAAAGAYPGIPRDIDGELRRGKRDVGADQVHPGPGKSRPLRGSDVGPDS
jgi:hypothetical protein